MSFTINVLTKASENYLVTQTISGIKQVDTTHFFWLFTNFLMFIVISAGIILVIQGMKRTDTLKTGSGPWLILGLSLTIPPIVNEIFDELEIIVDGNFYPTELYDFIFTFSPFLTLIGALALIIGIYRQYLVGENLSRKMMHKNTQLTSQKRELSKFAHTLKHDLRNELTLILATLELMERKKTFEEEDIELIKGRTHQVTSLIDRSIELADAGLIVGEKELVNLNKLVEKVCIATVPTSIKISTTNLPSLYADKEKLYQVFKNLLENAVIHAKPSTIEIASKHTDEELHIHITHDGKPVRFEMRTKMFQKDILDQESDERMGLRIIMRIIEAHGWQVMLDTTGRTVVIIIPQKNLVR
ncbi:MAG: sensor histidine kinase [Candidatus Hodarchaeales archaeon]|jgi:signal transduction histidine kinase